MTFQSSSQPVQTRQFSLSKKIRGRFGYQTLYLLFILGSIAGFLIEGVCHIFKAGFWENHSAVVCGPFCIIYGVGAVAVYAFSCCLTAQGWVQKFLVFTLSGAVVEYIASLFQEACFGSVSWDYSSYFLNIGGRVSLQMALFWGILGLLFMEIIFPLVNRMLCRVQGKTVLSHIS